MLPSILNNSALDQLTKRPKDAPNVRPPLWSLKAAFLICFGYANFCFFNAWQPLESHYWDLFLSPPVRVGVAVRYFLALLADTALLTLILWGVYVWITRRSTRHAQRIVTLGFLALLVIPLNLMRTEFGLFSLDNRLALISIFAVGIAAIIWHSSLIKPIALVLVFSWPLMFVEVISSAVHVISAGTYVEPALATRFAGTPARRLIWIVFDEFDKGLAFDSRPEGLSLPNLDALKSESFSGSNVYRSQRSTPLATSSLIFGKVVRKASMTGPTGLNLTFTDGARQSYPFNNTVFSIARARGINVAIGGWFMPYCRLYNASLTDCTWAPGESNQNSISTSLDPPVIQSVPQAMAIFVKDVLGRFPGMDRLGLTWAPIGFAPSKTRAAHQVIEFERLRQAALRYIVDPQLGFVYLHFPIPHIYGIYNPATSRVEAGGTYFDNLQLVDKTVGELRSVMEQAHMWDSATVLVSADHSLRRDRDLLRHARDPEAVDFVSPGIVAGTEGRLVPFLLKLPSQQAGARYDAPFNAVLTRDLLLSVLFGNVSTPEQATQWLDAHRERYPISTY